MRRARRSKIQLQNDPFSEAQDHGHVAEDAAAESCAEDQLVETKIPGLVQEAYVDGEYNLNIVKDYDNKIDPFYLSKKDPNFEYMFLYDEKKNLNVATSNMLFQGGGWQICPGSHLDRIGVKKEERSPDGLLRRGDQILAFMPKKLFLEKQAEKIKRAELPMKTVERNIKHGDPDNPELRGLGHPNQRGLQTAEQLRM
jgi:hypothetical protein